MPTLDFPGGLAAPAPLILAGSSPPTDSRERAEWELSRALQRVRLKLSTPRGSVPLDRTFGMDPSILDAPVSSAARLRVAVAEALRGDPDFTLVAVRIGDPVGRTLGRVAFTVELSPRQ
ncbi:hypothetical protein [Rubrivirga sp. IMCC45206]|uniref:hypothetical protein n=1 Tax=Rubrivirga sp. IMCC45206 TaxID=3391614 RepID=UPI00398FE458